MRTRRETSERPHGKESRDDPGSDDKKERQRDDPESQQIAGGAVTLSIQGTGSHDHLVELTAAEVAMIRNRLQLTKQSAMNRNHQHTITFNGPVFD